MKTNIEFKDSDNKMQTIVFADGVKTNLWSWKPGFPVGAAESKKLKDKHERQALRVTILARMIEKGKIPLELVGSWLAFDENKKIVQVFISENLYLFPDEHWTLSENEFSRVTLKTPPDLQKKREIILDLLGTQVLASIVHMIDWEKEKLKQNILIKFSDNTFVLDYFDIEEHQGENIKLVKEFLNTNR